MLPTFVLGAVGAATALAIHVADLYDDFASADTLAHFGAGVAIGAALSLVSTVVPMGFAGALGWTTAIAFGWELYEVESPMAGLVEAGPTDTSVDVIAVIVGSSVSLIVAII